MKQNEVGVGISSRNDKIRTTQIFTPVLPVQNFARNPVAMFTLMVLIAMQHRFYSIDATHILLIAKQPIATTKEEFNSKGVVLQY